MEIIARTMTRTSLCKNTESSSDPPKTMTDAEFCKWQCDNYNDMQGDEEGPDCPICKNKGLIFLVQTVDERANVVCTRCTCTLRRQSLRRMENSGLMHILEDFTFDTYLVQNEWQKTIKDAALRFAAEPQGWFFIGGQVGCGKTHICTAICGELIKQCMDVRYMMWRDEVVRLKAIVGDLAYQKEIELYKNAQVLYIDDFLKHKKRKSTDESKSLPSDADMRLAFQILNHRVNHKELITIISSEKTIAGLIELDEAVGSRIYQKAGVYGLNVAEDKTKNQRMRGFGCSQIANTMKGLTDGQT